ncbi:MAG TPA: Gfo/Idh/MocA family oxidoreductase, partial [Chitinophagaceae bacterium]|nr:Gfo/Idh/MocA family oxidoreductase [Chitinophagaceae bacterium]
MATQHNYRNSEKEELLPLDEVSRPSVEAGKKAGIALVGLGKYSEEQLGPALLETRHCRLAGIVTGTSSKIPAWQTKYDIPDANVYTYDNFDSIKGNKEIDIVYIVLPNALHAEFAIRAARAGKHVICEKPMA